MSRLSVAIKWQSDPKQCSHCNNEICPTCDFDSYYALSYIDCPWRDMRWQEVFDCPPPEKG